MKVKEVVGIDVSKQTINAHLHCNNKQEVFDNDNKGFRALMRWVTKSTRLEMSQVLICFEHTGLYSYPLALFLSKEDMQYCIVPALEIKKSMGVTRGKNDRVDAIRIAEYAYLRKGQLNVYIMPSKQVFKLHRLLTLRERMVKQRGGYSAELNELKGIVKRKDNQLLFKSQERMVFQLAKQIKRIEEEIKNTIQSDDQMDKLYTLITSVKGVGLILATNFLVTTNCFSKFDDGRKFACYAGIAPFEQQSGTSIKGNRKVNHMANKKMKALLHVAAMSAITYDPELKKYYQNRIQTGKSKMSTLNIVRNKIVHRVFAVVKRGTPYVPLHQHSI